MPLHIFEPRYCELVETLLANPDTEAREFGVIAVRDGRSVDREGVDALYEIGTGAVLRTADRCDGNLFDIVTIGSRRFLIHAVDTSSPLATASVEFLDEPASQINNELLQQVVRRFTTYRSVLGGRFADDNATAADLPDDPTVLSYLITASMVLPTAERQSLLGALDANQRLTLASQLLARENALISVLSAIPALDLLTSIHYPN